MPAERKGNVPCDRAGARPAPRRGAPEAGRSMREGRALPLACGEGGPC